MNRWTTLILIAITLVSLPIKEGNSQVVYQDHRSGIYPFLDELANLRVITLHTTTKPYSRKLIAEKLLEAKEKKAELTNRQQKELEFYLKDFNKELKPKGAFDKRIDLLFYKDSLFTFTANPILGGTIRRNSNGLAYHRRNGGRIWGYAGEHVGIYASLRDNGVNQMLALEPFLNPLPGANYKTGLGDENNRSDFSEMQGGITYSWDWGHFGIVKDDFIWGNNYHGANIFSAKQPSFAYIDLKMRPTDWLGFQYVHGWLVSEVIDSSRTYTTSNAKREVMQDKYLAANLLTFTPIKYLDISIGNSIIYADNGVQLPYLIPVMFYKSVDHTYNSTGSNALGQNSQMFADISVRNLKYVHLYGTIFMDELDIGNFWDEEKHTNLFSMKGGIRISGVIPNVEATLEYTRTNPWTYQHQIPTTTFASNGYGLGHYLTDNSEETFASLRYKPLRGLVAEAYFIQATKGPSIRYQEINGNPNVQGLDFMKEVAWESRTIGLDISYEVINDGYVNLNVASREVKGDMDRYTPDLYHGNTLTLTGGVNFGF